MIFEILIYIYQKRISVYKRNFFKDFGKILVFQFYYFIQIKQMKAKDPEGMF